jgi:hypothetical protein
VQERVKPGRILNRDGLVELVFGSEIRDDLRTALLAGQCKRRIAGQQPLKPEHEKRNEEQRRYGDGEPTG